MATLTYEETLEIAVEKMVQIRELHAQGVDVTADHAELDALIALISKHTGFPEKWLATKIRIRSTRVRAGIEGAERGL
jgi:hypothetical protein